VSYTTCIHTYIWTQTHTYICIPRATRSAGQGAWKAEAVPAKSTRRMGSFGMPRSDKQRETRICSRRGMAAALCASLRLLHIRTDAAGTCESMAGHSRLLFLSFSLIQVCLQASLRNGARPHPPRPGSRGRTWWGRRQAMSFHLQALSQTRLQTRWRAKSPRAW